MSEKEHIIKIVLTLMQRTDLKGSEVQGFMAATKWLNEELEIAEKASDNQNTVDVL